MFIFCNTLVVLLQMLNVVFSLLKLNVSSAAKSTVIYPQPEIDYTCIQSVFECFSPGRPWSNHVSPPLEYNYSPLVFIG